MRTSLRMKLSAVRLARERLHLTREQLAVKAGGSSSTLYLAEVAATAAKIAPLLGVSAAALRP
jgi:DNA-binding XRE family transcriptional regulator